MHASGAKTAGCMGNILVPADVKKPTCCLPGCAQPVSTWGEACRDCLTECGDYIAPAQHAAHRSEQQIADELTARDTGTINAYAQQAEIQSGTQTSSAADRALRRALEVQEGSHARIQRISDAQAATARRRNQVCWLCTNRRTCDRKDIGWECDDCQKIQ